MTTSSDDTSLSDKLQTEVHTWYCFPESINEVSLSKFRSVLSAEELERFHRFKFEKDRHSYLVSHALLRNVLSRYIGVHASELQFASNEHGKPELSTCSDLPDINFNLTHTDGLSACVVSSEKPCGIDAENIQRKNKLDAVAKRMFADEELARLDEEGIQHQFYSFWTLREAYLKALGTGLAGSSKDFYFDIDTARGSAVIHHRYKQEVEKCWQFRLYQPTPDHILSVAVRSHAAVTFQLTEFVP